MTDNLRMARAGCNLLFEMGRRKFVGGNWKMNGSSKQVEEFSSLLKANTFNSDATDVIIAPPFVYLEQFNKCLSGSGIVISAQNVSDKHSGAFTGEISASMLKDIGINWAIIGHSERRQYYNESNQIVGSKVKTALNEGLSVILCIGESLEERESGATFTVLKGQIDAVLEANPVGPMWEKVVIAYEPVWAIGTGKVATPQQAQETHHFIRGWIKENLGQQWSENLRIIYGGSVNGANCHELLAGDDIDGFLVGGASLKPEFLTIIKSCQE